MIVLNQFLKIMEYHLKCTGFLRSIIGMLMKYSSLDRASLFEFSLKKIILSECARIVFVE